MTRQLFIVFLIFFSSIIYPDNLKSIDSEIKHVTVYLKGVQVTRDFSASIKPGSSTLKAGGLTPYLDAKTLQLKGDGNFTILYIRHQMNYIDEKEIE